MKSKSKQKTEGNKVMSTSKKKFFLDMDFRFHTKVHVMLLDRYVKGVGKKMNHFVMVCKVKEKVSASHRKDKLAARTFQKQRSMHTHNSK